MKKYVKGRKKKKVEWSNQSIERLVLFADIMGFKSRVQTTNHSTLVKEVSGFLDDLNTKLTPFTKFNNLKIAQFSDSILIVANGSDYRMFNLISKAAIALMQIAMSNKIAIKGCISKGLFTVNQSKNLYLGQALVDAYMLHDEIKYYGVVVHNTAETIVKRYLNDNNPYKKSPISLDKGKVNHYHLCWNLVDSQYQPANITDQCNNWLDNIEETVSGKPRQYIDNTREVLNFDATEFKVETDGEKEV